MSHSTPTDPGSAIPTLQEILALLAAPLQQLLVLVQTFRAQPPTPERTFTFETQLRTQCREAGRLLLEHEFNRIEPDQLDACPLRLRLTGEDYRRRPKSPKRIGTCFGEITLRRCLYEAVEPGLPALFPLEVQLGLEAGLASPDLAERLGLHALEHEQEHVRIWLAQEHQVLWSVASVRKVTAALRDGLASFRESAQVDRLLELLANAFASKGKHKPVLAVGRDGIQVPIRSQGYHEGVTATVSVHDRRGRRLGTVYLGQMPQAGQGVLSTHLTALITGVLTRWHAQDRPAPRLAYLTDGGHHPKDYYQCVLRRLDDPWRPGHQLVWQWVLDFWHAVGYVHQLAEALFGSSVKAGTWFGKWRTWLRDRTQGLSHLLRSAMWHYNHRRLSKAKQAAYWKAYRYLRKHGTWMKYASYRGQGLPIGSGVTEAACKTVFAQRLKRSGMTWSVAGGQVILDLRVLQLSQVWPTVHRQYLRTRPLPSVSKPASQRPSGQRELNIAA